MNNKFTIYILLILVSCLFTTGLNVLHMNYVLNLELTPIAFAIPIIAGVVFGFAVAHIKLLSQRLTQIAYTDSLTQIFNRLHFNQILDIEIGKVTRYGGTFSIIFFDLDYFKSINDTFGHLAGDRVLCDVSQIISKANRSADIYARYGGEEFIILTPSTNLDGALIHAERLRKDIESHDFSLDRPVTCSFGVAEFNAKEDSSESVIKRADSALYFAKENGRNRVEEAQ